MKPQVRGTIDRWTSLTVFCHFWTWCCPGVARDGYRPSGRYNGWMEALPLESWPGWRWAGSQAPESHGRRHRGEQVGASHRDDLTPAEGETVI
jgi:hypothetical protein